MRMIHIEFVASKTYEVRSYTSGLRHLQEVKVPAPYLECFEAVRTIVRLNDGDLRIHVSVGNYGIWWSRNYGIWLAEERNGEPSRTAFSALILSSCKPEYPSVPGVCIVNWHREL